MRAKPRLLIKAYNAATRGNVPCRAYLHPKRQVIASMVCCLLCVPGCADSGGTARGHHALFWAQSGPSLSIKATKILRKGHNFVTRLLHHRTKKRADAGSQRHRQRAPKCYTRRGAQYVGTTSLRPNGPQHCQKGE